MTEQIPDLNMDATALYREEVFTDQRIGTIRQLIPVNTAGEVDSTRLPLYIGSAQMMTPAGALPLSFQLDAKSLVDAIAQYGEAAGKALEQAMEELRELQRQASSSIVVPGRETGGSGGIQMP